MIHTPTGSDDLSTGSAERHHAASPKPNGLEGKSATLPGFRDVTGDSPGGPARIRTGLNALSTYRVDSERYNMS
jgi:hypothetical protein